MYPVSDRFLQTISSNARHYYWTGTITNQANQTYTFGNEDIVKGSGYITRSCCGSNAIELGSVYAAELGISLLSNIDRYTLDGAEIRLTFHLVFDDGTEEAIPMGIFEITEANRNIKTLEIKAYDYMLRLDEPVAFDATSGTVYTYLHTISEECLVPLAQTREQIDALPNGDITMTIYTENDIETYRDLLYYLAQTTGCIAQINREGALVLIPYGNTPVAEIPWTQRYDSKYSDFVTRYTAVSSTNQRTGQAEYYALEVDDGLTMNLEANPLLQFSTAATRERIIRKILDAIAVVEYVPCEVNTIGNPALDPMDCLTFSGGHADSGKVSCITSITYNINGKHAIRCVGKNPKLAEAKSKNSKNISALITHVDEAKTIVYDFTNTTPYTVGENEIVIIDLDYVSTENTSAMFLAEVLMNVTGNDEERTMTVVVDGEEKEISFTGRTHPTLTIKYKMNDSVVATFIPQHIMHEGPNMLTLFMPISNIIANSSNHFEVLVQMEDGSATIGEEQIKATLSGQGMAAGISDWNGRIALDDAVAAITVILPVPPTPEFAGAEDSVVVSFKTPSGISLTDAARAISVNLPQVPTVTITYPEDIVTINAVQYTTIICTKYYERYTFDLTYVNMDDGKFQLQTQYHYAGEPAEIDRGLLTTIELPFDDFAEVTDLEVKK